MTSEIVLEVLAEGGSITLFRDVNDIRQFWMKTDESGICSEDSELEGISAVSRSDQSSFEATLAKLDRYKWVEFWPQTIHPEYREAVLDAVRNRVSSMDEGQSAALFKRWFAVAGEPIEPTDFRSLLAGFRRTEWSAVFEAARAYSGNHVYAIVVTAGKHAFPLYVGRTGRLSGRIGDYIAAQFQASTDFRVGEAIKYLTKKPCHIELYYRPSASYLQDEKNLIRELLLAGYTLMNFLASYDYSRAIPHDERVFVHRFCDMALLRSRNEWRRVHGIALTKSDNESS